MKKIYSVIFLLSIFGGLHCATEKKLKIVALVPGHNDARYLPNCFKALAHYADAIVYLDDASTDNSVEIAQALAGECRIAQIICKKEWIRNAASDRNIMLHAGRAVGGTHFITIDADEMFTANCLEDNKLKTHILNLKPGERLAMTWIQLWRSADYYRYDDSVWANRYMTIAFCDDGTCFHHPRHLCESRTPDTLNGLTWCVEGYTYGTLHYQFANFDNLLRKQAWYRCQEHVLDKKRSFASINNEYNPSRDEVGLRRLPAPREWFEGYSDFLDLTVLNQKEYWREKETMDWFIQYGLNEFVGLDIWDTEWQFHLYQKQNSSFLDTYVFKEKNNGIVVEIGTPTQDVVNPVAFLQKEKNWQVYSLDNQNHEMDFSLIMDNHNVKNMDLIVIHQYALCIDAFMYATKFNAQAVSMPTQYIDASLKTTAQQNGFFLIPYEDNGYGHFLKIRYM
ncbi:MAG TPA: glycosyltransferase family A protein [Patescibacteria group bacterium]|jgi:glycosyltransferase involved in cell wall biosynthesis|nr:glycosyltransferase family A protein [Patescibacteria group bacterium]